jgi:imidazolonepropionase-like amidohydrolase
MKPFVCGFVSAAFLAALAASTRAQQASILSAEVREFVAVDAGMVALTGVRVIDGTGAPPRHDQTVLIRNQQIESIGPSARIAVPEGTRVLELPEHTVIPGIVGMHDHLGLGYDLRPKQDARLLLGAGVTTIRTAGTHQPYADINLKREIDEGRSPGPRVYVTSPYLTGPGQPDIRMAQVANPDEARRFVNYWADEGVSWIKVYTRIRRQELAAVIKQAHARGLRVTGHLCAVTAREAAELGIDNVEHGPSGTDFDPQKQPDVCPQSKSSLPDPAGKDVRLTMKTLVAKQVAITGTLPEAEAYEPHRPTADSRVLDFVTPATLSAYRDLRTRADTGALPSGYLAWLQMLFRSFVDDGGLLAAGTDPVFAALLPGFADQRNYELLIEVGFAPEQAVRIMTANGARVLGVISSLGTLEVGKRADLVVIKADPASPPKTIRNVVLVFKNGVGYDSPKLIESVRREVRAK